MKSTHKVLPAVSGVLLTALVATATQGIATILDPAYLIVDVNQRTLRDLRQPGSSGHALKTELATDPLPLVVQGTTPVVSFETSLHPGRAKGRSEVRVRGRDIRFADSSSDPYYYTQFDVFLPSGAESDAFERDRTHRGDWNLIWQCAQIGAAPPYYHRVTSPPLSLQLYGRRLFVKSISDYAKYSRDVSDSEVYRTWQRRRTQSGQAPEAGERTRDGAAAAKVYGAPLRYAGYLRAGQWNRVFMKFRLGQEGGYRVWVNDQLQANYQGSIGYRSADDCQDPNPVVNLPGEGRRIRKRASVRFGIYQGYGDPARADNPSTRTKILFRRFALGTDWNTVRFGGR